MVSPVQGVVSDHPRMRGEHAPALIAAATSCGSSPHARGAHDMRDHWLAEARIIPACAGSTNRDPVEPDEI